MKKILPLSLILLFLSVTALAQRGQGNRIRGYRTTPYVGSGQITRPERFELRKDQFRYQTTRRKARRDGYITPFEKRELQKRKRATRRDAFRFRHNGRRRII